jgi:hypothetical protein
MERAEELQHWSAAERREAAAVVGGKLTVSNRRIASSDLNDVLCGAASSEVERS